MDEAKPRIMKGANAQMSFTTASPHKSPAMTASLVSIRTQQFLLALADMVSNTNTHTHTHTHSLSLSQYTELVTSGILAYRQDRN